MSNEQQTHKTAGLQPAEGRGTAGWPASSSNENQALHVFDRQGVYCHNVNVAALLQQVSYSWHDLCMTVTGELLWHTRARPACSMCVSDNDSRLRAHGMLIDIDK